MGIDKPRDGAPGTTDQSPRWEGPEASRPRGYLPARDDPDTARDAVGETNRDPERNRPSDALKAREAEGADRRSASPAVRSLHKEQVRQASKDEKGELQEGLEDTFPASDPLSTTGTSVVKRHVETGAPRDGKRSETGK